MEYLRKRLKRGSIDVFITRSGQAATLRKPRLNLDLARRYIEIAQTVREKTGAQGDLTVASLLGMKDVVDFEITIEELDAVFTTIAPALDRALEVFEQMRAREGAVIGEAIRRFLDRITGHLARVEEESPKALASHREKLRTRLAQVRSEVQPDEFRLEQELLYHAERSDISEEVDRLKSHIAQFAGLFTCGETCGKKMDFIIQEMNREANTIGSKAADAGLAREVVELKTAVERLREQVQNLE